MHNFVTQSGNAVHARLCILCADHLLIVKIGPKNKDIAKMKAVHFLGEIVINCHCIHCIVLEVHPQYCVL